MTNEVILLTGASIVGLLAAQWLNQAENEAEGETEAAPIPVKTDENQ